MRSFWSDPYLWVHLAGIAALPVFLEICLLGLAVGDPVLPTALELLFVAAVGISPVFWMQWQRPFYIFSLLAIALKPAQLTEDQRRLLRLFKTQEVRVLTAIAPVLLAIALWQLYKLAPLAAEVTPFAGQWRLVGLLVAAIAFLACNLFLQVPLSVLRVLLASEAEFAAVEPYPLERVGQDFTVLGLRVKQILPAIAPTLEPVAATNTVPTASEAIATPTTAAVVEAEASQEASSQVTEPQLEPQSEQQSTNLILQEPLPEEPAAEEPAAEEPAAEMLEQSDQSPQSPENQAPSSGSEPQNP